MSRDDELRAHFDKQAQEFAEAVNQALAIAHGDAMAAVRTLVVANIFLHEENERLRTQISSGYMHGQTNKAAS
jgi:regulator of replication initiation timing